ncbi:2'-hydroxyisoflavone reductase [Bacillus mesophilus]|uniref:NAD-dependent epimerase/dehydratase family protein n=1 Tax=Bacillus mesophilus TaxID=1808955 RepID=A0A6M0QC72_9BACI|nr:SDR family oxidoreductase [Bacillus mesophilus]MBM7663199.1 2'-hydroxyisoflavone reductase [Bacillus mesophilus]NEY73962.1 NAD-dependent epimerase/dehydratase family protein [Bacillus mesophilus]
MNILVLGGTKFLGRHLVEESLRRGHEVTIFTRGKTNADLFPEVEHLIGDRDGNLSSLIGRKWDAVIDTSGYVPRVVGQSTAILASATSVYTFISSISVYKDFSTPGLTEDAEVLKLEDETVEEVTGETYGALKALCEEEVKKTFPDRHLIIRPGLIVGPHDPTDRFTYWPSRVGNGGEVLAPDDPNTPVQIIDVRDLASFIVQQLENKAVGTYHVTGPDEKLTLGELLEQTKHELNAQTTFTWVPKSFLDQHDIKMWIDMPLYIPLGIGMDGFSAVNLDKSLGDGLSLRPIRETIVDTFKWSQTRDEQYTMQAGITKNKEQELLETWQKEKQMNIAPN